MNYYELTFTYTSPIDTTTINDVLAAGLGEIGFESFTETADGMLAYVPEKVYDEQQLADTLNVFPLEDVSIHYTIVLVEDRDWNEEWEKNYFKPIRIGRECIIRASFHEPEEGFDYTILIDPKMAFGTGNHETTYLMISEILRQEMAGKDVLDMGCGTAVLGILAKMKGARRVVAVDIDEWAYENAHENIRLNGTEDIEVLLGGAEQIADSKPFDIVIANINRNILLQDIQYYAPKMKAGGQLFLSGFYKEDIPVLQTECERNKLTFKSYNERNNWAMVIAQK